MSDPPKSVWLPRNSVIPAPDPLAVYFSLCRGQAFSSALMKPVIAFAWAVEPLAVKDFLPPQSTFAAFKAVDEVLPPLLQEESTRAAAASRTTAAPDRLSFT